MKPTIIHSIATCLAAFALSFMVACSGQDESWHDSAEASLYLNVEPIVQARSGVSGLPDNEKMNSVRVIVLHPDGTVEHNRLYQLDGATDRKYIILKVKSNEKKKIFLFANEESVSVVEGVNVTGDNRTLAGFFGNYTENAPGFEAAVNNLYFAPDYSAGNPIPMSSVYEIDFPRKGNYEGTFYVVRVATKFMVNFFNWRGERVTVNNFTIASHADKNYLMAHIDDSEQNRQLFNGKTWINWLKVVSDASSENDDYATTEAAGWLKDYQLPTQADITKTYTHGPVTVGLPTVDIENPDNSKPGVAECSIFYLPESKNLKANATDGEQEYTLIINIAGRSEPFVSKMPNLKALFRNTQVVVNIVLYHSNEIVVDVIPYSEVLLEPEFGL